MAERFVDKMARVGKCVEQYNDGLLNETETVNTILGELAPLIGIEPTVDGEFRVKVQGVENTY